MTTVIVLQFIVFLINLHLSRDLKFYAVLHDVVLNQAFI